MMQHGRTPVSVSMSECNTAQIFLVVEIFQQISFKSDAPNPPSKITFGTSVGYVEIPA